MTAQPKQTVGHTPTPWRVYVPLNSRGQELPPKIVNDPLKSGFICSMGYPVDGNREANAALIVLAVNSYESLQARNAELVAALMDTVVRLESAGNEYPELVRDIRQALARAEGRTV